MSYDDQFTEADERGEPMDDYEAYSAWLQSQPDLMICNGDDLIRHLENATRYDEFLHERQP